MDEPKPEMTLTAVALVVSQLEAASALLKFAADDLELLRTSAQPDLAIELASGEAELLRMSRILFERALYLGRLEVQDFARSDEDVQNLSGRSQRSAMP